MSVLQSVILGIIEGVTEFLPISSTGHLILANNLLKIPSTESLKTFDIVIQLGAILAALLVYWKTIFHSRKTCLLVLAAFVPTAILGALLHGFIKQYLLGSPLVVAWSLLLGGIALIIFELAHNDAKATVTSIENMTFKQATLTGIAQTVAMIPGVSRSAATILGGMSLGISRRAIVDFSFLLAIPTMAGASVLDLVKTGGSLTSHDTTMIAVGFLVSFLTAYVVIHWLLRFIKTHTLIPFGIYRIIVGVVMLWLY